MTEEIKIWFEELGALWKEKIDNSIHDDLEEFRKEYVESEEKNDNYLWKVQQTIYIIQLVIEKQTVSQVNLIIAYKYSDVLLTRLENYNDGEYMYLMPTVATITYAFGELLKKYHLKVKRA